MHWEQKQASQSGNVKPNTQNVFKIRLPSSKQKIAYVNKFGKFYIRERAHIYRYI